MTFHFLHVFEQILCALHKDDSLKGRVLTHDSTAAVGSYNKLTEVMLLSLELDQTSVLHYCTSSLINVPSLTFHPYFTPRSVEII